MNRSQTQSVSSLNQSGSSSSLSSASMGVPSSPGAEIASVNSSSSSSRLSKSPSSTLSSFFSNIGQSLANHTTSREGAAGRQQSSTPPPSPSSPAANLAGSFLSSRGLNNSEVNQTTSSTVSSVVYGSYPIKYIGSTPLRRRHTLPMLNWIVTDLLYQSKCDGDELHVKIRNCVREEDSKAAFEAMRTQLSKDARHHGLSVRLEMCQLVTTTNSNSSSTSATTTQPPSTPSSSASSEPPAIAFQVSNAADGQLLLSHHCRRIFLFGKFTRESSLFYYLHKSQEDVQTAVPTLYVFQAKDETQLSEIAVKYNELRPKLNIRNDRHLFMNSLNAKTGITSNCFEVLHIGSVVVNKISILDFL